MWGISTSWQGWSNSLLRGKATENGARVLALEGDSQLLAQLIMSLGRGKLQARRPKSSQGLPDLRGAAREAARNGAGGCKLPTATESPELRKNLNYELNRQARSFILCRSEVHGGKMSPSSRARTPLCVSRNCQRGAGVLAGRRRLVQVSGACPTADHALCLGVGWTHPASPGHSPGIRR